MFVDVLLYFLSFFFFLFSKIFWRQDLYYVALVGLELRDLPALPASNSSSTEIKVMGHHTQLSFLIQGLSM